MASGSTTAQRRLLRQHICDLSLPCKSASTLASVPGLLSPTFISPLTTQNNRHHDVSQKTRNCINSDMRGQRIGSSGRSGARGEGLQEEKYKSGFGWRGKDVLGSPV